MTFSGAAGFAQVSTATDSPGRSMLAGGISTAGGMISFATDTYLYGIERRERDILYRKRTSPPPRSVSRAISI